MTLSRHKRKKLSRIIKKAKEKKRRKMENKVKETIHMLVQTLHKLEDLFK